MPATFGVETQVATTTLVTVTATTVTASKVRRFDVRAANVGSADANITLVATNGTKVINRAKNFPVNFNTSSSAPDLETGFVLPADYYFQIQASAGATIEVSFAWVEDDA